MDIKTFFENFKEKFTETKNNVVSWIQENKKLSIIIVSLLSLMLICIILLVGISGNKKKKTEPVYEKQLELNHDLVVPNGPELPRDYTISRQPKEAWSEEEAERWFSTPSETDMKGLSKANDNMVDKILGGTP